MNLASGSGVSEQVLAPKAGSGKRKQGVAAPVRPGDVEVHLANVACTLLILGDALFPQRGG